MDINVTKPTQEMIMTRGIPGSGKSTWAKRWVMMDPANRVRVNRDEIRMEMFKVPIVLKKDGTVDAQAEEKVTVREAELLRAALREGKSVVSDNTHLLPSGWKKYVSLAQEFSVPVTNKDFPISLEEAKRRNAGRERKVSEPIIEMMFNRLGPNGQFHHFDGSYTPQPFVKPESQRPAVIFDMDGTLTDIRSIRHFVAPSAKKKNFDLFHRSSLFCPPHEAVVQLAKDTERAGFAVVIVTAREDKYREVTELWLKNYGVTFENMYMRPTGDNRQDALVKADILKEIEKDYDVVHAVDDRPEVIQVWNSANIRTTLVPGIKNEIPEGFPAAIMNPLQSGRCIRCGKSFKGKGYLGPSCKTKN